MECTRQLTHTAASATLRTLMPDPTTFTIEQIATAARELRQAAGADEERFSIPRTISMLSEEIRLLRERGFTNQAISDLLNGFDLCISPEDLARNTPAVSFAD